MRLLLALALTVLCHGLTAQYAGIRFSEQSFEELKATAKAEGKIIFVDAYTTWCGPCKLMSSKVFTQEKVGEVFNERFLNAKINMEAGEGPRIARGYNVVAYPTYLFINGDGELVHKALGYIPADELLAVANDAVGENSLGALNNTYAAGERSPQFMERYLTVLASVRETDRADEVMQEFLAGRENWSEPRTLAMIIANPGTVGGERLDYLFTHPEEAMEVAGSYDFMQSLQEVLLTFYVRQEQLRTLPPTDDIVPFYSEYAAPLKDRLIAHYAMFQADQMRDTETYLSATRSYLAAFPTDDHVELNLAARNFLDRSDDPGDHKLALNWAKKAAKCAATFPNLSTLAHLYHRLGKDAKARKTARRAVDRAKETGYDYDSVEVLLSK